MKRCEVAIVTFSNTRDHEEDFQAAYYREYEDTGIVAELKYIYAF